MKFNSAFPVLSTIAKVMSFVGWLLVIAAVCVFGYAVMEANQPRHFWGNSNTLFAMWSAAALVVGLFVEALAEIIGVLFAIELNTRQKDMSTHTSPTRGSAGSGHEQSSPVLSESVQLP
jgi:hypothetical protein